MCITVRAVVIYSGASYTVERQATVEFEDDKKEINVSIADVLGCMLEKLRNPTPDEPQPK